jgi:hypothetical protein
MTNNINTSLLSAQTNRPNYVVVYTETYQSQQTAPSLHPHQTSPINFNFLLLSLLNNENDLENLSPSSKEKL